MRHAVAVCAALLCAFVVVILCEALAGFIYVPPASLDFNKPEDVESWMLGMPIPGLLIAIAGYAVASVTGTLVALRFDAETRATAWVFGLLFLGITAVNMFSLPRPTWMAATTVGVVLLGVVVALRVAPRAR